MNYLKGSVLCLVIVYFSNVNCLANNFLTRQHVCDTMTPVHPDDNSTGTIPVQTGPSPFILMPLQNQVQAGGAITILLTSVMNNTDIRGYFIQSKNVEMYNVSTGMFVDYQENGMLISCQSKDDTLLHNGTDLKRQPLMFKWIAPDNFVGSVMFWASVAESFQRFWVGVYSTPVTVYI